jgi:hypothetical protein
VSIVHRYGGQGKNRPTTVETQYVASLRMRQPQQITETS